MKVINKDYINKNEFIDNHCEFCCEWFDIFFDDKIYVIQLENDTILTFCNDYNCYHNWEVKGK